jgi:hypothetical protein
MTEAQKLHQQNLRTWIKANRNERPKPVSKFKRTIQKLTNGTTLPQKNS